MIKKIAAALTALALAAGAQATVIYTGADLPTGEFATTAASTTTGPAFTGSFSSATAGAGELTFSLNGFASLDGQLFPYEDDFTLTVNGATLFYGTFNLGGGGANVVYSAAPGVTAIGADPNPGDVSFAGGTVSFVVPVSVLAGTNTVGFGYTSLDEGGYVGVQGLGDEGWSVSNVQVAVVPEPGSLALMLAGLGIVGGLARRRGARKA